MPRYVFHMQIQEGEHERLGELNARYEPALIRYVELLDYDGAFEDFGAQLASDPEVREFLRAVNGCFVQSLREMGDRRMERLQQLGDGDSAG